MRIILNNLEITYKLTKKMMQLREEIINWARISRESDLKEIHRKKMMEESYEIDTILREIGIDWIEDYEANNKIREKMK